MAMAGTSFGPEARGSRFPVIRPPRNLTCPDAVGGAILYHRVSQSRKFGGEREVSAPSPSASRDHQRRRSGAPDPLSARNHIRGSASLVTLGGLRPRLAGD